MKGNLTIAHSIQMMCVATARRRWVKFPGNGFLIRLGHAGRITPRAKIPVGEQGLSACFIMLYIMVSLPVS